MNGEDKGEKKRGGRSDGQEGRRRSNRRGKVVKPRANGKTLTVDMNGDGAVFSRDYRSQPASPSPTPASSLPALKAPTPAPRWIPTPC